VELVKSSEVMIRFLFVRFLEFRLVQTKKKFVFIHVCTTCVGYTCMQNLSSKQDVLGSRVFTTTGLDETSVLGD
jgi:hypothetical protein